MSKNVFNSVQYPKIGSNTFDLSHDVKLSFKMGGLYPSFVMDVLPGDKIRMSTETMLRFAPLISPVMHRVNVTTHFFFVPNRLVWPNWEKWITGEEEVEPPYVYVNQSTGVAVGSLGDYMGLPTGNADLGTVKVNAIPFAAYHLIWKEYYRDQNLIMEDFYETLLTDGDNSDNYSTFVGGAVLKRAWQHDYFTASLPFAQKGDAVTLPLGNFSNVPVELGGNPADNPFFVIGPGPTYAPPPSGDYVVRAGSSSDSTGTLRMGSTNAGSLPGKLDPNGTLVAMTSQLEAEAADINSLRRAFRLQEWLEKNARGGTRYIENVMAHFGVRSSDARLNRPEYLGGAFQKMVISEVLSTAETDVPVGQMAGHGISVGAGKNFTYRAEEHGFIIGLINVQPVTVYFQGLNKMYSRESRFDYYWPSFANIGEQEVKNKEIMVGSEQYNEGTFGYVPRYAEYRYMSSRVAGEMRTSLAHWHLARMFSPAAPPSLNQTFIEANPSTRIFAVQNGADHIYGHIYNSIKAVRKIPRFGTPSF